jgi:dipeptidyl aminopeptidase/acylaminoacyl peptidase
MDRWLLTTILLLYPALLIADLIPAANFGSLPPVAAIEISPDGQKLVMLRALEDTYHAVVMDLKTNKSKLIMAAAPDEFRFSWCRFANNSRVVCQIHSYETISGDPNGWGYYRDGRTIFTKLIAANIDGSNVLQLVPRTKPTGPGEKLEWNSPDQSTIISWLRKDDDHILMQIAREDRLRPSVYKLNINNNKMKRVKKFNDQIFSWLANDRGQVLAGFGYNNLQPVAFTSAGGRFKQIKIDHLIGANDPIPLSVAADNKSMWISASNGENTMGIHRVSLKNAEVLETLYSDPGYDINNLFLHPTTREPISSRIIRQGFGYHWYNKEIARQFEEVSDKLPGKPSHVQVVSYSSDMNRLILYSEGNETLPTYYLYDRNEQSVMALLSMYGDVGPIKDLESVSYPARDGLIIPAYLSLPDDKSKGPFPTIILPHGGPWARDTNRFDYWVQFFHSRGYAVLKPNYRGSAGFGDEFLVAGYKQWGLKMQDDVIDGLDWMIDQGYTDPERVCLVGASYGGYVVGVSAYKTPERFKCAVSFAGVANLDDLSNRWQSNEFSRVAARRIQSGKLRDQNSPLKNVDKIALPLLIVHGDVDRSVMIEQSREFVAALEKAGKDYTYIEQANGNHHLSLESHRIEFFEAMDKFLQKHLSVL